MSGDETRRFCSYCSKHVHNLEALSVSERLALLSSPAATICARYKIAIRRPRKGHEESYRRRLMKCGAAVAFTSSAFIVLWEMHAELEKRTFYRAVAARPPTETCTPHGGCGGMIDEPPFAQWPDVPWPHVEWPPDAEWPGSFYVQREVWTLGIMMPFPQPSPVPAGKPAVAAPLHIDLDLAPAEINKLLQPAKPRAIELNVSFPPKKKLIRKISRPRGT